MSVALDLPVAQGPRRFSLEPDPMERADVDLRAIEGAVRTILRAVGEMVRGGMLLKDLGVPEDDVRELVDELQQNDYALVRSLHAVVQKE